MTTIANTIRAALATLRCAPSLDAIIYKNNGKLAPEGAPNPHH